MLLFSYAVAAAMSCMLAACSAHVWRYRRNCGFAGSFRGRVQSRPAVHAQLLASRLHCDGLFSGVQAEVVDKWLDFVGSACGFYCFRARLWLAALGAKAVRKSGALRR